MGYRSYKRKHRCEPSAVNRASHSVLMALTITLQTIQPTNCLRLNEQMSHELPVINQVVVAE